MGTQNEVGREKIKYMKEKDKKREQETGKSSSEDGWMDKK